MSDSPKFTNPYLKALTTVVFIVSSGYYMSILVKWINKIIPGPWDFIVAVFITFLLGAIIHFTGIYRFKFSVSKRNKALARPGSHPNGEAVKADNITSGPTDGIGHIKYFWEEREKATKDIIETFNNCTKYSEIFVSGIGLGTLQNAFSSQEVINNIARCIAEKNAPFKLTILFPLEPDTDIRPEITLASLAENINGGRIIIENFIKKIKEKVPQSINLDNFIELKNYNISATVSENFTHKVIPRHFLLRIDNYIYVGPYLAQKEGKNSFLMKLEKPSVNVSQEGMYNIYLNEIRYLLRNSTKTTLIHI